jgi:hypothetical protein
MERCRCLAEESKVSGPANAEVLINSKHQSANDDED